MSAIDFKMELTRENDPKGDRVKIVMSGKALPYKTYYIWSYGYMVRTTRNSAFPLVIRSYASFTFAREYFSIIARTPVRFEKRSACMIKAIGQLKDIARGHQAKQRAHLTRWILLNHRTTGRNGRPWKGPMQSPTAMQSGGAS